MPDHEDKLDHQEVFREAFLSEDMFGTPYHLPQKKSHQFYDDIPNTTPKWLDDTRVVSLLVGILGLGLYHIKSGLFLLAD